jgi:hypothetical protein
MKPKLEPLGTERLKLEFDTLLSTFAFKFNLRRYTEGEEPMWVCPWEIELAPEEFQPQPHEGGAGAGAGAEEEEEKAERSEEQAGAYTRPLLSST